MGVLFFAIGLIATFTLAVLAIFAIILFGRGRGRVRVQSNPILYIGICAVANVIVALGLIISFWLLSLPTP